MTNETLDLLVHAAALQRVYLKLTEQIRFHDACPPPEKEGTVARNRLVSELEAVAWAENMARKGAGI